MLYKPLQVNEEQIQIPSSREIIPYQKTHDPRQKADIEETIHAVTAMAKIMNLANVRGCALLPTLLNLKPQ